MKILLISSNTADNPYPVFPLGLSIISKALKKDGHNVNIYDYLQEGASLKLLSGYIKESKPDLVGISIRNIDNVNYLGEKNYIDTVIEIVKGVREIFKGKIIIGGAGFSLMPGRLLEVTGADYGIVGEGENAVRNFVDNFTKGFLPTEKLIYSKNCNNGILGGEYRESVLRFYLKHSNMIPVQTKRGCCNKCIYCTYPLLEGRSIRCRPIESVIRDIKNLVIKHGVKTIYFTDSVFNDSERNYIKLLKRIKSEKISFTWTAFINPSGLTEADVSLMYETGLTAAEIGADAATDTTLKKLGKNFTFGDIIQACRLFQKYNISTFLYYMMGGPGENKNTVFEGIKNIKSIRHAVSFIYMGIRILPNTPLERLAKKENIIDENYDLYKSAYYITPEIDRDWMEKTLNEGFKDSRNCIFPPDKNEQILKVIHKLGYTGLLKDKLISRKNEK